MNETKGKTKHKVYTGKIPAEAKNILDQIKKIEIASHNAIFSDIIGEDDVVLRETMNSRLRTFKIEYVKKMHVTETGEPRKICQKSYGKDDGSYWITYLPDKRRLKCSTKQGLFEKLYEYYSGDRNNPTFGRLFEEAMEQRKRMKGITDTSAGSASSQNTITRNYQDYEKYIDSGLANKNILEVTPSYLKEYTIDMLNRLNKINNKKIRKKAFQNNYKGILNIVFDYAEENGLCVNFVRNRNKFKDSDFSCLFDSSKKGADKKAYSPEEIEILDREVERRMNNPTKYGSCYTNGYMFKLAKLTGMRAAELSSLKKEDIVFDLKRIHVHSQQLKIKETLEYAYADYTKNERGNAQGGRYVPLLPEAEKYLKKLFRLQDELGIDSEWVFTDEDGNWVKNDTQYIQFLKRMSRHFGLGITNNHAIRMYFNSYVLIPAGIMVTDRAKILGHSPEVNLHNYSFEDRKYCENAGNKIISYLKTS